MVSITLCKLRFSHIPSLNLCSVDLGSLRLTGQSVTSVTTEKHDHKNPRRPENADARTLEKKLMPEQRVYVRQDRSGFGGGFKILEEYRRKKMNRKSLTRKTEEDDDEANKDQNAVTKDEIFKLLNLGNAEGNIGSGKYG